MTQEYGNVFRPIKIGNVMIKNRIESAPISCLTTPDGYVRREMIEFYKSFAKGGAGIVTIGDAVVDYEYAMGHHGQLNLSDDKVVIGLGPLVEAIQRYGAKASIEINHAGRWAWQKILHKDPIGPSPIPTKAEEMLAELENRRRSHVQEMTQDMIDKVVESYAEACNRCLMAGFEMVMLHGAHGHLLAQFASSYSNKRTDSYGGGLENRARFIVEILTAIRKKVGDRLAIEYRISGDEFVQGGMHLDETIEFIKIIEDKIDLIHVSAGLLIDPRFSPQHMPPAYLPYAFNVERAEKIKKAVSIPVTCVGAVRDLKMADEIIGDGKADIIAIARAMIADNDIVNKTRRREVDDIRPCVRCNLCLEGIRSVSMVLCAVNPVSGREIDYRYLRPAEKKQNIIIVGGGPAGMEAAQIAASRGHQVILFEKDKELGGALHYAAAPPFKADMKRYLEWMIKKTHLAPIDIRLSTEATADRIREAKPDVLILAVGADPYIPDIHGSRQQNVTWAGDVIMDRAETGNTVVVVGAGLTGCETALFLAAQGKKVTVVDMISELEIAQDASSLGKISLMELLQHHGVEIKTEVKLERITESGVEVIDKGWNRHDIDAESVVLSLGSKARVDTVAALDWLARDVYVIGDCAKPRDLKAAIHDGFNVAAEI